MKAINAKRLRQVSEYVVLLLTGLLLFVLILSFEISLPLLLIISCIVGVLAGVVYFISKSFRVSRLSVYVLLVLVASLTIKRMALESFRIPSRSMETTLAVGDRILVTKVFTKIKRDQILVFRNTWLNNKENMVKRCLGLPGDSIRIDSGIIYVNAQNREHHSGIAKIYQIRFNNKTDLLKCAKLYNPFSINWPGMETYIQLANNQLDSFQQAFTPGIVSMAIANAEAIGKLDSTLTGTINSVSFRIPAKGDSIQLFKSNIVDWVKRIAGPERDSLRLIRDKMKRGEIAQCYYYFKENYYFVAGDNRCHSSDSRHSGSIPESSIIGTAAFIFFSLDPDAPFPFNFKLNRFLKIF